MDSWPTISDITSILSDLGIDIAPWTASDNAKLKVEIYKAQREFERLTRRKYEDATITEKLDGSGRETIILRYFPINSVTSISIIDIVNYQEVLTVSEYRVDNETGVVTLVSTQPQIISVFPLGNQNIEVVYNYGYTTIPDDIKDAIIYMTVIQVIYRCPAEWEKLGLRSLRIAQYSESYGGDGASGIFGAQKQEWTNKIKQTIANYKRTLVI